MTQKTQVANLLRGAMTPLTPNTIARTLGIPAPSVRRTLAEIQQQGQEPLQTKWQGGNSYGYYIQAPQQGVAPTPQTEATQANG